MGYVHDIHLDLDYEREALVAAVAEMRTLFRQTELPIAELLGKYF